MGARQPLLSRVHASNSQRTKKSNDTNFTEEIVCVYAKSADPTKGGKGGADAITTGKCPE